MVSPLRSLSAEGLRKAVRPHRQFLSKIPALDVVASPRTAGSG